MAKKTFKWALIVIGILLVLLLIGIITLPLVLPLDKIKDFAIAKISETIHREVKIEKVAFDLFSGIKLEKLSVANAAGFTKKPFVSADAIELRYAFWPLLSRQVIIKEIRLVKPEVLIEKNAAGKFNFSDLLRTTQQANKPTNQQTKSPSTKPPFNLFVNKISLSNGKLTYIDHSTKTTNLVKDINVDVAGIVLGFFQPIDLKASAAASYKGKDLPIALAGKIGLDLEKESINLSSLSLSLAGEKLFAFTKVSHWKKAPAIDFAITSDKLSADPLLAVFLAPAAPKTPKDKPKPGELTKTVNQAIASLPRNLILRGNINLNNLSFQKFNVDKAVLSLSLANRQVLADLKEIKIYQGALSGKAKIDLGVSGLGYQLSAFKLASFNASPFTNAMVETFLTNFPDYKDLLNKVYGTLDASFSLSGSGVEVPAIMTNLSGSGSFSLKNGELKRLKIVESIADKIKTPGLKQDLKISEVSTGFAMKNKIVEIQKLALKDSDLSLTFDGGLDLNRLRYVEGNRLLLKASPSLTKTIPKEFDVFRNDQGWLELAFELTGELKKPIPIPKLEKAIEKTIGKIKAKIEAKKIEFEEKVKAEIATKEEEVKKALEEEKRKAEEAAQAKAEEKKKKLEEEAKKKLKEMIKF